MQHPGLSPLDPESSIGQLRVEVGDIATTPLDPAVDGQASYAVWSDNDLAASLARSKGSVTRAAGSLIRSLAIQYSAEGKSIKTDDLAIDVKGRGSDLLAVAKAFFAEAEAEDIAGGADYFDIVPFTPSFGDAFSLTEPARRIPSRAGDLDGGTP